MAEHVEADEEFVREDVTSAEARERFVGEGQPYKVELIDDLVADRRRQRLALHQRPVHRPLPRPARAGHQAHQGVQAAERRGRLLARRLRQHDAHPHLRDGLPLQEGPRRRTSSGSSRRAPATTASSAASSGCSRFSELSPGQRVLAAEGHRGLQHARRALARDDARARLRRGQDAAALRRASCGRPPATGASTARTCSRPSTRTADGPQAHELPRARAVLRDAASYSYRDLPIRYAEPGLLHRHEPSGTLHGLLRVRHFIQDDAHIFCTDEQVEQEVLGLPRLRLRLVRLFGFDIAIELSTRPEQRIGTDEMWDRVGGARSRARSSAAATSTRSTRATAPSTGRRSTSTCATRSAARGSSGPSSSTTTSPSASTSPTPAPTTPSTGR